MKTNSIILKLIALLFLINSSVMAQVDVIGTAVKLPGHPRILLLKGEEGAHKANHRIR